MGPVTRSGKCCGATGSTRCILVIITLDSNAQGANFEIASGALPLGALYYQVNCGPQKLVGESYCLNGPGPHALTFCKPGGNANTFRVSSSPKFMAPDSLRVTAGCTIGLGSVGLRVDTSLTWRDTTSSNSKYDSFLNCTKGCDSVTFTPDSSVPSAFTLDYNRLNDSFSPVFDQTTCEWKEWKFEIFNRWGEKLYQTTDPYAKWDGKYKGEEVHQGVYMWILFYVDKRSLTRGVTGGTVTLLK